MFKYFNNESFQKYADCFKLKKYFNVEILSELLK